MHSEHMELWKGLFQLEVRSVEQGLIPYVGQLEHPSVPVERWVIDPNIPGLLDGPCDVLRLPTHSEDIVHTGMMT